MNIEEAARCFTMRVGDRILVGECYFDLVSLDNGVAVFSLVGPTEEELYRRNVAMATAANRTVWNKGYKHEKS